MVELAAPVVRAQVKAVRQGAGGAGAAAAGTGAGGTSAAVGRGQQPKSRDFIKEVHAQQP